MHYNMHALAEQHSSIKFILLYDFILFSSSYQYEFKSPTQSPKIIWLSWHEALYKQDIWHHGCMFCAEYWTPSLLAPKGVWHSVSFSCHHVTFLYSLCCLTQTQSTAANENLHTLKFLLYNSWILTSTGWYLLWLVLNNIWMDSCPLAQHRAEPLTDVHWGQWVSGTPSHQSNTGVW